MGRPSRRAQVTGGRTATWMRQSWWRNNLGVLRSTDLTRCTRRCSIRIESRKYRTLLPHAPASPPSGTAQPSPAAGEPRPPTSRGRAAPAPGPRKPSQPPPQTAPPRPPPPRPPTLTCTIRPGSLEERALPPTRAVPPPPPYPHTPPTELCRPLESATVGAYTGGACTNRQRGLLLLGRRYAG
jgi:hypothetical protein